MWNEIVFVLAFCGAVYFAKYMWQIWREEVEIRKGHGK